MMTARKRVALLSFAVASALAASGALAQTQPGQSGSTSRAQTPKSETSASTGALNSTDQKFVSTASETGAAEIAMAKVANDRAASVEVKNFASRMVSDHQKVDDQLKTIASNKHADLKDQPSKKDQAEIDKLSKLNGASFDKEYVKDQLSAHKEAVALFQKESKSAKDSDLKQFAQNSLPTLEDHLRSVEQISKTMTPSSHASTGTTSPTTKRTS